MTAVDVALSVMWIGLTAYVLLGGADFGGGWWDLTAGSPERGRRTRSLIEHSLGPVWEANHVWLIFVIVLLWTVFPPFFAAVMSTLYIPLTLAALGIIGRGAAFAFRKVSTRLWQQRMFGATFAFSSVATPFFLGAAAGAIASGRVPPGIAAGDPLRSWFNPTSIATGVLAIGTAAYLAAVYLTRDAQREGDPGLVVGFRRRALGTGAVVGALAIGGLAVLHADAPALLDELTTGRARPLLVLSVTTGLVSIGLLLRRRYLAVRISAALAVASLLWGWGVGQYPRLLPGLSAADAAATTSVITATLISLGGGVLLLAPSLWWLFSIFQRAETHQGSTHNLR